MIDTDKYLHGEAGKKGHSGFKKIFNQITINKTIKIFLNHKQLTSTAFYFLAVENNN